MKTVVISIGGSILITGDDDLDYIERLAKLLKELKTEMKLIIVVGGGRLARQYIKMAKGFNEDRHFLDSIGIMATQMNSMVLIAALDNVNPKPFGDIDSAIAAIYDHEIFVTGGTIPGQTTDTVAARLAEAANADIFINATAVNGVYDSDPRKNPDAKKIDRLTFDELIDIVGTSLDQAGTNVVIDPVAAKVMKDSELTTFVLDGRNLENLRAALVGNDFDGTIISKE